MFYNLKVLKVLSTPVSAQQGSNWTPSKKLLSQKNFGTKLTPYLYTPKITINQQKKKQNKTKQIQNIYWTMAAIPFHENGHLTKIWKTTF